jgi:hypothetical protein
MLRTAVDADERKVETCTNVVARPAIMCSFAERWPLSCAVNESGESASRLKTSL